MKTVVGLFESVAKANQVKAALLDDGFNSGEVTVIDRSKESYTSGSTGTTPPESVGERIKHFFTSFGEGDHSGHETYASSLERGGAIVSVKTEDGKAGTAADMLHEYGASEVEDNYATGSDSFAGDRETGEQVIPIVQENLEVGKREVNRGGVRVYSHLVETPVSADVSLRNERVVVERRPVNRVATSSDLQTGSNVVELTAMGEEAVVGKTSRVVEEVTVGKVATERTEQIHDTVRHTEVDVEETPAAEKNRY